MSSVLALDIGNETIKYIEVRINGTARELISYGMIPSPAKGLQSESSLDQDALVEALKRVLHDGGAKSQKVIIALPEAKVFTRVIEVPNLSEKELANSIHWEAEQYIPMPLDDVFMDFSKLRDITTTEGIKKQEILLVAAPKTLVEKYQEIVELSGLIPVAMETDVISTARSLVPVAEKIPTVMVVDIGARTTTFSILRSSTLAFSRTIEIAGTALSRAIAQEFNFEMSQADEYKKTYGMEQDKLEGKVHKALLGVYTSILEEFTRAIAFYQKKSSQDHISSVILTGGSSRLPGLVTNLARELNLEIQIGNPWVRLTIDQKRFVQLGEYSVYFAACCGLALRQE